MDRRAAGAQYRSPGLRTSSGLRPNNGAGKGSARKNPALFLTINVFPGEDRIFNALPMFHSFAREIPDVQKLAVPGTGKINYVSLKEDAGRATVAASGARLAEINATSVAP